MKINIEENFEVPKYLPTQIVRILKRWAFINKCRIESETPSSYLKIDASQIIYPTGIYPLYKIEINIKQINDSSFINIRLYSEKDLSKISDYDLYKGQGYGKIEDILRTLKVKLSNDDYRRFYSEIFIKKEIQKNRLYFSIITLGWVLIYWIFYMSALSVQEEVSIKTTLMLAIPTIMTIIYVIFQEIKWRKRLPIT